MFEPGNEKKNEMMLFLTVLTGIFVSFCKHNIFYTSCASRRGSFEYFVSVFFSSFFPPSFPTFRPRQGMFMFFCPFFPLSCGSVCLFVLHFPPLSSPCLFLVSFPLLFLSSFQFNIHSSLCICLCINILSFCFYLCLFLSLSLFCRSLKTLFYPVLNLIFKSLCLYLFSFSLLFSCILPLFV